MHLSAVRSKVTQTIAGSAVLTMLFFNTAQAAVYGGSGLNATPFGGLSGNMSIRSIILAIITFILNLVLLLGVLAVIIAGVFLIVSGGDEAQKDKAKKIIFYAIIGIIVIVMARVIVLFANELFR